MILPPNDWNYALAYSVDLPLSLAESPAELSNALPYALAIDGPVFSRLPGINGRYKDDSADETNQVAFTLTQPIDWALSQYQSDISDFDSRFFDPAKAYDYSLNWLAKLLGLGGLWNSMWSTAQKRSFLSNRGIISGKGSESSLNNAIDILNLVSGSNSGIAKFETQLCQTSRLGQYKLGAILAGGCKDFEAKAGISQSDNSKASGLFSPNTRIKLLPSSSGIDQPLRLWQRPSPATYDQNLEIGPLGPILGISAVGSVFRTGPTGILTKAGLAEANSKAFEHEAPSQVIAPDNALKAGSILGLTPFKTSLRLAISSSQSDLANAELLAKQLMPFWIDCSVGLGQFVLGKSRADQPVWQEYDVYFNAIATASSDNAITAIVTAQDYVINATANSSPATTSPVSISANAIANGLKAISVSMAFTVKQFRVITKAQAAESASVVFAPAYSYANTKSDQATTLAYMSSLFSGAVSLIGLHAVVEIHGGKSINAYIDSRNSSAKCTALAQITWKAIATANSANAISSARGGQCISGAITALSDNAKSSIEIEPITAGYAETSANAAYSLAMATPTIAIVVSNSDSATATAKAGKPFNLAATTDAFAATTSIAMEPVLAVTAHTLSGYARTLTISDTYASLTASTSGQSASIIVSVGQPWIASVSSADDYAASLVFASPVLNANAIALANNCTMSATLLAVPQTATVTALSSPAIVQAWQTQDLAYVIATSSQAFGSYQITGYAISSPGFATALATAFFA